MDGPSQYKIAILEDDSFHRKVLQKLCEVYPWLKIFSFANPQEALQVIQSERIQIVLVDINLPGMFGDDVLRHCMSLKQGIQAYVITGAENMVIANRCLDIGARIVIRKPVSAESIGQAVHDAKFHLDRNFMTLKDFAKKRLEA